MRKDEAKKTKFPDVDPSLIDVHRPTPRTQGGAYEPGNMEALSPVDHMKEHGTYRERTEWFAELKALMDSRQQTLKTSLKLNNQMLAIRRGTDTPNEADLEWVADMQKLAAKREGQIKRQIDKHISASDDPTIMSAMGVVGMGPMTVPWAWLAWDR